MLPGRRASGLLTWLRLEILAGLPQIRFTHSVVYEGQPDRDFLRASEVLLAGDRGAEPAVRFWRRRRTRNPVRFRSHGRWYADFRYAELYQDSVSHWRLRRWVDLGRREVFCEEGQRSDGWMELRGDRGRVAVAVREFWQNHPKTLFADAGTGDIRIGLYPARADRLDLQRYSDLIYPLAYEAPCTWKNEVLPFDKSCGAHGVRKTHDFVLMLDEANPSARALFYNRPLRLQWTPKHLAHTRAVVPAAVSLDSQWLERIRAYVGFLKHAMENDGGNGYVDYFDLPLGCDPTTSPLASRLRREWVHQQRSHAVPGAVARLLPDGCGRRLPSGARDDAAHPGFRHASRRTSRRLWIASPCEPLGRHVQGAADLSAGGQAIPVLPHGGSFGSGMP